MTHEQLREAWHKGADHYRKLAADHAEEARHYRVLGISLERVPSAAATWASTGKQLACLVLAEYCAHRWSGNYGGPTLEMVALDESLVGQRLDEVVGPELTKVEF